MSNVVPGSEDVSNPMEEKLNQFIQLAEQFVKGWSGSFLDVALRRAEFSPVVHQVVLANSVRQLRSLRSTLNLCLAGDSSSGAIVVRSMWETAVKVGFVMKPNWIHTVRGKKEKLTSDFRADLLLACEASQLNHAFARFKDKANRKSQAQWTNPASAYDLEAALQRLGAKWSKVVSNDPWTPTGQSLSELSGQVSPELAAWYTVVEEEGYERSPGPCEEWVQKGFDGANLARWESPPETSLPVIHNGIYLTLVTLGFIDQHADIGIGGRSMLNGLRGKLDRIDSE